MIECVLTYDLLPNVDAKAYAQWSTKAIETMAKQRGMTEFRANRSVLGSPLIRTASVWETLEDWAKFNQGEWQTLQTELRAFATGISVQLWGPSPILAKPIRTKM